MLVCVIPMKDGHLLRPEVYKSIAMQSVPIAIMPITRPPLQEELEEQERVGWPVGSNNYQTQSYTRNIGIDLILQLYKEDILMYHCTDVVLWKHDAVALALDVFKDSGVGAVYFNVDIKPLPTYYQDDHFDFASVLIRKEVFTKGIRFRTPDVRFCSCTSFKEDMLNAGWRVQYLTTDITGSKTSWYNLGD